jgi:hypothetical protein
VRLTIHGADQQPAVDRFLRHRAGRRRNLNESSDRDGGRDLHARLLIDEDIPLNHGVLRPVEIVLPTCLLNLAGANAGDDAGGGGRQRGTIAAVVDVLLGALGLAGRVRAR